MRVRESVMHVGEGGVHNKIKNNHNNFGLRNPSTTYPQIRRFSYFNPGPLLPPTPIEKRDAITSSFAIERDLAHTVCLLRNAIMGL